MQCPVCEAENPDDVLECAGCGRGLTSAAATASISRLDGLEPTQVASADLAVAVEALPGLEMTQLEAGDAPAQWTPGPLELEPTFHEPVAGATPAWTADVELDLGRAAGDGERTPVAPETATCPWCGAVSLSAVCDACGRRKARYLQVAPRERAAASGETVTCPSCFARVAPGDRCSDCGMSFPLHEL